MKAKKVTILVLLLAAIPFWVQAYSLDEIVSRLKEEGEKVQRLKMQFLQERRSPAGKVTKLQGTIWLERPNGFRMEVSPPYESITVIKSDELWMYFPKEKMAQRVKLSKDPTLARWIKFLQEPWEEIRKKGILEGKEGDRFVIRIDTSSDFEDLSFLKVWVDQKLWLPVKVFMKEKTGEEATIIYSKFELNPNFAPGLFELNLSADVQVTDL